VRPVGSTTRIPAANVLLIALVAFVTAMDNTIVVAAAPTIGRELGLDVAVLQWLSIAYLLPYAGLLLLAGALVDRFGERRTLLTGLTGFGAFAVLAALSGDAALLIAARVGQGCAAALVVPATMSVVRTRLPQPARATGAAIWTAALAAALALGPWLGGVLAEHAGWRWIFVAVLPFVLPAALLVPREMPAGDATVRVRPTPALVVTTGLVLVTGAVVLRGVPASGSTPLLLGAAGVAALVAFVRSERRANTPLVPRRLVRDRPFLLVNVVASLWGVGIGGVVFFTPLRYQEGLGLSPQEAALPLVLVAVALIVTAPLVPHAVRRLGPQWTIAGGLVLVAAGLAWLAAVDHLPGLGSRLAGLLVLGVGSACTTPLTALALDRADTTIAGAASGVLTASRELASALGVALFGLVMSLAAADAMAGYRTGLLAAALLQLAGAGLTFLALREPSPTSEPVRTTNYL
jgi:MFS family permease